MAKIYPATSGSFWGCSARGKQGSKVVRSVHGDCRFLRARIPRPTSNGESVENPPMWTTCGPVTSMQSPRASTKDSGRRVEYVDDGGWRGNHTFDRIRHRAWIYTLVPDTRCTDRDHMQSNSDPRPPPPRCWDRLRIHSESPLELRGEPGTLPSAHYAQSPTCSAITSYVQRGRL